MKPASIFDMRSRRRRKALAHQCRSCRAYRALQVVNHPAGVVVTCRVCGDVRSALPAPRS
jgi:ribosomal protein S27E